MNINANTTSIKDIRCLDVAKINSITIENSLELGKAKDLGRIISENGEIKIIIVVDPSLSGSKEELWNLDILKEISQVQDLAILAFGTKPLENLNSLSDLKHLHHFKLQGFYKKNINLEPLEGRELKSLGLEFGIADKKQAYFVNNQMQLENLEVSTIDLSLIVPNYTLKKLKITNSIKFPESLFTTYPCLSSFEIHTAKGADSFDFISELNLLEELKIGNTKKFVHMPSKCENLKILFLINTPVFSDINGILKLQSLDTLWITRPVRISLEEFKRIKELRKLKNVTVVFDTEEEDIRFEKYVANCGWQKYRP